MGAHSIPQPTEDMIRSRDISLTLEERGHLKEMIRTYRTMFSEQMVALKFSESTDMQKREVFRIVQLQYSDSILNKLISADS